MFQARVAVIVEIGRTHGDEGHVDGPEPTSVARQAASIWTLGASVVVHETSSQFECYLGHCEARACWRCIVAFNIQVGSPEKVTNVSDVNVIGRGWFFCPSA